MIRSLMIYVNLNLFTYHCTIHGVTNETYNEAHS